MNTWSGSSLTPHLRICDGEEEQVQELEVRHEGSNGSLFFTDPLSYHPSVWRYDSNLDHHHHEQGPKLEDFLSNSHQTDQCPINHNQTNINCTVVRPQYPNLDPNRSYDYGAFERVDSVSVFKSWLRQDTPKFPLSSTEEGGTSNTNHLSSEETDYNTNGSILSLAMSHGACSDLIKESNVSMLVEEEPVKVDEKRKRSIGKSQTKESVPKKSVDSFGQRTSKYRGVTRHRWTGRYEAHLWDNTCKKEGQTRKGKQGQTLKT